MDGHFLDLIFVHLRTAIVDRRLNFIQESDTHQYTRK